jgi:hypothetical protein
MIFVLTATDRGHIHLSIGLHRGHSMRISPCLALHQDATALCGEVNSIFEEPRFRHLVGKETPRRTGGVLFRHNQCMCTAHICILGPLLRVIRLVAREGEGWFVLQGQFEAVNSALGMVVSKLRETQRSRTGGPKGRPSNASNAI